VDGETCAARMVAPGRVDDDEVWARIEAGDSILEGRPAAQREESR
jgi:hypothetical protein